MIRAFSRPLRPSLAPTLIKPIKHVYAWRLIAGVTPTPHFRVIIGKRLIMEESGSISKCLGAMSFRGYAVLSLYLELSAVTADSVVAVTKNS